MRAGDIAKISNKKNAQKVKQEKLAIFTKILIHTFHALCFHYTYCLQKQSTYFGAWKSRQFGIGYYKGNISNS